MKLREILGVLVLAALVVAPLAGCAAQEEKSPVEKAGESMEKAGDAIREAAEDTGEALEEAAEDTGEAIEEAAEDVKKAAEDAAGGN